MQRVKSAKVGITLLMIGVVSAFVWWYSAGYSFLAWYWAYQISALVYAILMVAPSFVISIVGLTVYIVCRKEFWKSLQRGKSLLALGSLAYMFVGGFFFGWTWAFSAYGASKLQPPYALPLTYYVVNNLPYFTLFALWFAAGLLVLTDAVEAHWKA